MPAERTRKSNSDDDDGAHLTWAVPVEPAPQSIAFAPNVTPVTFNDPPSPTEPSFEPISFPSPDSDSARRPTHGKKRGEDHIPRPPNAFILFRSSFIKSQHVSTEVETNHSTLSKIIGLTWQNMPQDERQVWHEKAKKALEEHRKKWPQYAFRPSHTRAKRGVEKRKVREVEPKDMKRCAKIAELLVEGKKGAELDAAIQEFDRTHVPEIITRFETPITAGTYHRSSSAPIDGPQSKQTPHSTSYRRVRSVSSQPSARHVDEPKARAPLASLHSLPGLSDLNLLAPSPEYPFSSRSQPSFDPFAFDVAFGDLILPTSAELRSYPVTSSRVQTPPLCIDTAYGSECALDSEDPFALNYLSTPTEPISPCGPHYSAGLHVFDHENLLSDTLFVHPEFALLSKDSFTFDCSDKSVPTMGTDLPMSAFLSSLSAF